MTHEVDTRDDGLTTSPPWLPILNRCFAVIAVVFCCVLLWRERSGIVGVLNRTHVALLLASLAVSVAYVVVQLASSVVVLRALGAQLPILPTMRMLAVAMLGKYVPGKVWVITMRVSFLKEHGITLATAANAAALEHFYLLAALSVVWSAALAFGAGTVGTSALAPAAIGLAAIITAPFAEKYLRPLLHRLHLAHLRFTLARGQVLAIVSIYCTSWCILGVAIWLLVTGMGFGFAPSTIFHFAAWYGLAVFAGFVAIFAPGGIGVREGVFVAGLAAEIPLAEALFVALGVRLVTTAAEVATTASLQALAKNSTKRSGP